jgi:hypothetical protein
MIICRNCQHENLDGSMFCDECGVQLTGANIVTQNIQAEKNQHEKITETVSIPSALGALNTWASLHLVDSGQILPLTDRSEFTLGRVSEAQPIMPDIDLTPYQAYACGVSRLHAVLKREGKRVYLMDLGSSNGTYLNGKRLQANVEHPLAHGDTVSLGKLRIQVLLK